MTPPPWPQPDPPIPGLPFTPVLAQRLPLPVAPFPNEDAESYLARLAAANRTTAERLLQPSRWLPTPINRLDLLHILTGYPRATMAWALPALREQAPELGIPPPRTQLHYYGNPCRRCCLRRTGSPYGVDVHEPLDSARVCIRHRLWIGNGLRPLEQLDLKVTPGIVRAQIRHDRLARRYDAEYFMECRRYCSAAWIEIETRRLLRTDCDAVYRRLMHANRRSPQGFGRYHPGREAARYPNVIHLCALVVARIRQRQNNPSRPPLGSVLDELMKTYPLERSPRTTTGPWLDRMLTDLEARCMAEVPTPEKPALNGWRSAPPQSLQ